MTRPFVALLIALFAGGVAAAPVRALLPAYVEGVLHQPPLLTSVLLAIQLGTGGAFALLAGTVAATLGQRGVVLAGLLTPLCGAALFALGAPAQLVVAALAWGVAGGFQAAGGQSFMIASVRRERLGIATAAYFISSTASGALGAGVAGFAADHLGYRAVAAGSAVLGLTALGLAARFLPPLESGPKVTPAVELSPASYGDLLRRPEIVALCAIRYFPTVAWGAASLAIPLLVFRLSGNATTTGNYGTVSLLCAGAAQLATGRLVDRRSAGGVRPLLAPISAAILASAAGAALAAASDSLAGLFVAGTLWTMSAWSLSTTMPPLIREVGGPDRDRLVGLTHLMWSAGMLSGTLGAGALLSLAPAAPFVLAIGCLAVTCGVAVWANSVRLQVAGA